MTSENGNPAEPTGARASGDAFAVEVRATEGARVLRASGEIDTITAPALRSALLPQLDSAGLVVVDLTEVSFLGSSGLAVLVEAQEASGPSGAGLRLVCGTRIVVRALEATGLDGLFDIAPDLRSALRG